MLAGIGLLWLLGTPVFAEEPPPAAEPAPAAESPAAPPAAEFSGESEEDQPKPKAKKSSKGKRRSEKDAEGTQAPDRFEADTVPKSRYQLNGEHLEVDPD